MRLRLALPPLGALALVAAAALGAPPAGAGSAKVATSASAKSATSAKAAASTGKPSASAKAASLASVASVASTAVVASAKPASSGSAKPPAATSSAKPPAVASGKPPAASGKPSGKPVAKLGAAAGAPPAYVAMVKAWHLASTDKAPLDVNGRPKLVLYSINRAERVELQASTDDGDFAPSEIDKASWILRAGDGNQHPIDARLLDIVYALEKHFQASEVRFVSGYRTPTAKKLGSNHGYGRAIDLVIPGTIDDWVASYVRALGYTGAGVYVISGFVHVDVRAQSYYWIDKSGPGAANKAVSILQGEAMANDAKAKAAGRIGPPAITIGRDIDAALQARAKAVTGSSPVVAAPAATDDAMDDADDDDDPLP